MNVRFVGPNTHIGSFRQPIPNPHIHSTHISYQSIWIIYPSPEKRIDRACMDEFSGMDRDVWYVSLGDNTLWYGGMGRDKGEY